MYEAIAHCVASGCAAWRSGDDEDGIDWFQQASLLWLDAIEQHGAAATRAVPGAEAAVVDRTSDEAAELERLEALAGALNSAIGCMRAGDYVAAADRLEYVLLPLLAAGGTG